MPHPKCDGAFRDRDLLNYSQSGSHDKKELRMWLITKTKQELDVQMRHEHYQDGNIHPPVGILAERNMNMQSAVYFDYKNIHPSINPLMNNTHKRKQIEYFKRRSHWFVVSLPCRLTRMHCLLMCVNM